MLHFLREETGASSIDWVVLSAGVLALAVTIVTDVYLGATGYVS